MEKQIYITNEERKKCKNVVNAFEELFQISDTIVLDAGRYGFVKLQFYTPSVGFDSAICYTDSQSLFQDLWSAWLFEQLLAPVIGTPLEDLEYEELLERLPKEKQDELMAKRIYFKEKSEKTLSISCENPKISLTEPS